MTVTATTLTSGRTEAAGIGWPMLLGRTLGSEWTKLRSVRSTYGSLLAAVVGIAALSAWAITTDDQPDPATAHPAGRGRRLPGPVRARRPGRPGDHRRVRHRQHPHHPRGHVGAVTFPGGLVATALATLAASTILGIGTDGILAVSARSAAALTLTSLMVVGLGAVMRSAAGTITTAVAVLFAPPILGALVSNEVVATVLDYLPAGLSTVLVSGTGERYSPEVAALLLGAWAVGTLAIGVITLQRRDP
jgi:ABC-2 type transport system permease protein